MPQKKSRADGEVIEWVGPADQYLDGTPKRCTITSTPADESQVSPERAAELVATGLYAYAGGTVDEVK